MAIIAPGLPNITGRFTPRKTAGFAAETIAEGAFYVGDKFNNNISDFLSSASNYMAFDASLCSSLYKENFDTVQPPTISLIAQIKY